MLWTYLVWSLMKHSLELPSKMYEIAPLNCSPIWYEDKSAIQSLIRKQTMFGESVITSLKVCSSIDDTSVSMFALNASRMSQKIENNRIDRCISWMSVVFLADSWIRLTYTNCQNVCLRKKKLHTIRKKCFFARIKKYNVLRSIHTKSFKISIPDTDFLLSRQNICR